MKLSRLLLAGFVVSVLSLVFACSKQGEGERCDRRATNSGNEDCQSGLVCTARENLNGTIIAPGESTDEGRCCPADRTLAVERICQQATGGIGSDSGIPTNVGNDAGDAADAAETSDDASDSNVPDTAVADANDAG